MCILNFQRRRGSGKCQTCGNYKYIMCPKCMGTRRTQLPKRRYSQEFSELRCSTCDQTGTVRCPSCLGMGGY